MINASQLRFDDDTGNFSADMSDLGLPPGHIPQNLSIDAEGSQIDLSFAGYDRRDGEIIAAKYAESAGSLRANDRVYGFTATLWND